MERASREVPGLFRATFFDFFGSCSGRSRGIFPALPDSLGAFFEKIGSGEGGGGPTRHHKDPYAEPLKFELQALLGLSVCKVSL